MISINHVWDWTASYINRVEFLVWKNLLRMWCLWTCVIVWQISNFGLFVNIPNCQFSNLEVSSLVCLDRVHVLMSPVYGCSIRERYGSPKEDYTLHLQAQKRFLWQVPPDLLENKIQNLLAKMVIRYSNLHYTCSDYFSCNSMVKLELFISILSFLFVLYSMKSVEMFSYHCWLRKIHFGILCEKHQNSEWFNYLPMVCISNI